MSSVRVYGRAFGDASIGTWIQRLATFSILRLYVAGLIWIRRGRRRMVMEKALLAVVLSASVFGVLADTESVNGYTWTYRINPSSMEGAEIYGSSAAPAVTPTPTGAVAIPNTLGGKPVVCIGNYAFNNCHDITTVSIPDSITRIQPMAFQGCSSL